MSRFAPRHVLAIGWIVAVVSAYPGYMDVVSADQLFDARAHNITDWHTPVFSAIWGWLECVMAGPAPMLLLQVTLTLAGAYILLARSLTAMRAAVGACAVVVSPPVLATIGLISPQAAFSAFALAGVAAFTSARVRWKAAGVALLVIAGAMQSTGSVAVVPLVIGGFCWPGTEGLRRYAFASALALVLLGASVLLDRSLTDADTQRDAVVRAIDQIALAVERAPAQDDVALRAKMRGVVLFGDNLHSRIADRARHGRSLVAGEPVLREPSSQEERAALLTARDNLVADHGGALWSYRYRVALRVLGFVRGKSWRPIYAKFVPTPDATESLGHLAKASPPQKWIHALLKPLAKTPLFLPFVYAGLAIVLLPIVVLRRAGLAAALLASGLVFELSLAFVDVTPSFRDSHWLICATLVASVASWPSLRRGAGRAAQRGPLPLGESPAPASAA